MADQDFGVKRTQHPQFQVNPPTFFISAAIILGFAAIGILFTSAASDIFGAIQAFIANYTGWFFVLVVNIVLGYSVYLLFSKYGSIRLGGQDQKPEFTTLGWFAMLFSAGMGIGLLFYGVAEPMYHFTSPPTVPPGSPEEAQRAQHAMGLTFLHWGLHPWAVYSVIALGLAYFGFNRGMPLSIRSIFYPLIGNKIYGPAGHAIDILATVATLFGVATSLGLGVSQVNAGLNSVFGLPEGPGIQAILIAIITAFATISVVVGLDGGIRRLSEMNMIIAAALLLFLLILGPTIFILEAYIENIGYYIQHFPHLATWNETYTRGDWQNAWTVFYYGWWISWSPFVGMFVARVSKGRTIKEFIAGVLFVPTLVTFLWMTIMGDAALYIEMFGDGGIAAAVSESVPKALFAFLDKFPLASVTSILATIVIITFFVTSSDSGSLVIDIITAGGLEEPPTGQRIFWAVTEGVVAAVLLAGGGLTALQTAAITTGLPFAVLLLIVCVGLQKGLKTDPYLAAQRGEAAPSMKPAE
jgi:choline/glycine/proline betaine transport protein